MNDSSERREHVRCYVRLPLEIKSNKLISFGHTSDLSLGGVCIDSKSSLPIDSKVYLTLSIPKKEDLDVSEIKVIANVKRVHEVNSDHGATNAIGIKFKNISQKDLALIRDFLKDKFREQKEEKKADEGELEVEGLNIEITPIVFSNMTFFQRLFLREDYTEVATGVSKWLLRTLLILLAIFVSYHIVGMILTLIKAS